MENHYVCLLYKFSELVTLKFKKHDHNHVTEILEPTITIARLNTLVKSPNIHITDYLYAKTQTFTEVYIKSIK